MSLLGAIAVAITLFGVTSGAALAIMVGVLTEVPFMLIIASVESGSKEHLLRAEGNKALTGRGKTVNMIYVSMRISTYT